MSFYESGEKIFKTNYNNLVNHGGIVRLNLSKEQRAIIKEITKEHEDLECFEISNNDEIDLILRYKNLDAVEYYPGLMDLANRDFYNGKYGRGLKKYLSLLEASEYPQEDIYAKIGLCYLKTGMISKAEDYLMVANYKNGENKKFELNESSKYFEERVKRMNVEKYNTNMIQEEEIHANKLEYDNFDEIMGYISQYNSSIESAGIEFDLSSEERDTIKLIFAREFYKQGDIEKGNYYLNAVEQSPNKTKKIVKLYDEIRKNSRFYQYRDDNHTKKLVFVKAGKRKRED